MTWTGINCAFVVEEFFKTGQSVTRALRNLKRCFNLKCNDPFSSYRSVMLWMQQFRETNFALTSKLSGKSQVLKLHRQCPMCQRVGYATSHLFSLQSTLWHWDFQSPLLDEF